ncbi:MAG: nuclear transport factor 2 family protein [Nevskiales bacterium]
MQDAVAFAASWIGAWNAHDLERILALYRDDFEMSSPYIREIMDEPSGVLQGKAAIRAYWSKALTKFPDLNFELINVLTGANSVMINYYGRGRRLAAEVFFLDAAGKIARAAAHYA